MNKRLYDFFENDHRRIEAILEAATKEEAVNMDMYDNFRVQLLTHIKMEEKILFPAAQKANSGTPMPLAARLRRDHGAITALLVVPPTPPILRALRHILFEHDLLEEEPGGMYDACAALTQHQTEELLAELRTTTVVPVHPVNASEFAIRAARRAVERAGFDYDKISVESL